MALQQVNVLAFDRNSNELPNPRNQAHGSTYFSGTIMDDSNIVSVNTALAVETALSQRDKAIRELRNKLEALEARITELEAS